MNITKIPHKCQVPTITVMLRKYSPKAHVQSDSDNEVVFVIGQMIRTKVLIEMFRDLESRTEELGIESRKKEPEVDAADAVEVNERLLKILANTKASRATLWARTRAVFVKRAIHAFREKRMPLFSWVLPQFLLTVLFLLEIWGAARLLARRPSPDIEEKFREEYLDPLFKSATQFSVERLPVSTDINYYLLHMASDQLFNYVFNTHFGYQMTKATGTVLWYNGQIQHTAPLVLTAYNRARLRNITKRADADFSVGVVSAPPANVSSTSSKGESELIRSQNTYREVLPKVLRSIFLPLVSSLMCSNFVLFPIAERALLVKQLHLLTGLRPSLYWILNFVFDFLFYIVTALCVLPPLWLFQAGTLTTTDISLIFVLNLLHGYAALPCIYLASFLFDNPGHGFSTLAVLTFVLWMAVVVGEACL
ncbi:hypothetical protein MRX96_007948 [Rhipicephalus microplus]